MLLPATSAAHVPPALWQWMTSAITSDVVPVRDAALRVMLSWLYGTVELGGSSGGSGGSGVFAELFSKPGALSTLVFALFRNHT